MSYPCIDGDFFDVTAPGTISPQRRWQWHHRATAVGGPATFTPASNAGPPGTSLFNVEVNWTNTTGISQYTYAVATFGPSRYAIDGLKHIVIRTQWGQTFGAAPATPTMTDESRLRGYPDFGTGVISSTTYAIYYVLQDRQPTNSVPIGDVVTLPTTQQIKARVEVRWFTSAWGIDWYTTGYGNPVPERIGEVGPIQIDIYSTPVIP